MSTNTGTPPVIPPEFQIYDSYTEAPGWQLRFSMIWVAAVAISIIFSLPHLARSIRAKRAFQDLFGVSENIDSYIKLYESGGNFENAPMREVKRGSFSGDFMRRALNVVGSIVLCTVPGLELNVGQIIVITGYLLAVILCMGLHAPLSENSNRAGFIALAQLPVVFLFATKNSVLSLLLGPGNGYEKLNFVHRWAGRGMFIAALVHGSFWIANHLKWQFPIIGQQKETSGVAALGLLCVLVITSFKPVRRAFYHFFYVVHLLAFVAFFVTICYHTIYAPPWIFPPLAFFGLDLLLRFLRFRIKDAVLIPLTDQMTIVNIPFCTHGWTAGQHVQLRVFFNGRIFESHPLTILSSPPAISCLSNIYAPGITLGIRSAGDWSRALNAFAQNRGYLELEGPSRTTDSEKLGSEDGDCCQSQPQVPVQVMLDGPYGGCSLDLGEYETVLLFAGGTGATFTIGMLDDIVGRCVRLGRPHGERTRRIEFAWCVKSFGSIEWFAPALMEIAHIANSSARASTPLTLHISVYVTCLCDPGAVPPIPNCDVTIMKPDVHHILQDLVTPPSSFSLLSPSSPEESRSPSTPSLSPKEVSPAPGSSSRPNPAQGRAPDLINANIVDDQEIIVVSKQGHVTTAPTNASASDIESDGLDPHVSRKLPWVGFGGGVAVCASGPASLTREAANAVARLRVSHQGRKMGVVDIHTEVFSL